MSDNNSISFVIKYDGKFENLEGEVLYIGGRTHLLVTAAQALFTSLIAAEIVDVYAQRVWYKLPHEELKELKILCDGGSNFDSMCRAAFGSRVIEIYLEHDNASDGDGQNDGERQNNGDRQNDAAGQNVGDGQDNGAAPNPHIFHEAERVEEIVAGFVDEEEEDNEAYRNTPPQSDCEEDQNDIPYDRWRRGSGELKIMLLFDSVKEFREAVLEYALKGGWNIKFTKWGSEKSEAKCAVKSDHPCHWRIYCSFEESAGYWMVKTFQEEHSCTKDGYCRLLTDSVIANMFIHDIRKDPKLMPRAIQDQIQERHNLTVTHDICRKARKKALDMINREYDEQFERIKDYRDQILISNKDSTVDLVTVTRDDGVEVFDKFYVCFNALREIWCAHCRPIFGIDGCFLKSTTQGQLLAAVGRDANNQIYPIAWAVVGVENAENWVWFIQRLKTDLNLKDGDGFTIISDKQKGLVKAVDLELPKVEHRTCARHVYGNLKNIHPKKPQLKKLFWAISDSFNVGDYEAALEKLKTYDIHVYEDLKQRNPSRCSRAFFKTTSTCEDALNNFSESYNSGLEKARSLPLVEMLETMRRQTMVRIDLRKQKIRKHKAKFSLKVAKTIALEEKERKWCKRVPGPNGYSEVKERETSYTVNIDHKTCSCRRWDMTGIPCRHALKVFLDRKLNAEDYVADCYLTSTWQKQYSDSIKPVDGLKFWKKSNESTLQAPPREVAKGRNKNPEKRKKGIHESPKKGKKVTSHLKIVRCVRCGFSGHNATKCPNGGVPNKSNRRPRPKKQKTSQSESISLDVGEGPSQPTQTSYAKD